MQSINQSITFICQYAKVTDGGRGLPQEPVKLI